MGVSIKIFFVEDGDKLRRIPLKRYEGLVDGNKETEPLPEYAGRKVKYASVMGGNENGKPVGIIQIGYYFLSFDQEGRMRRDEWDKETRLSLELLGELYNIDKGSVVQATHVFARKQMEHEFRWKPSAELERAVRKAVFSEKKVVKKHRLRLVKPAKNTESLESESV